MKTVPFATKKCVPWALSQDWSPPNLHVCSRRAEWDVVLHEAGTSAAEGGGHQQTYFSVSLLLHVVSQRPQREKARVNVSQLLGI